MPNVIDAPAFAAFGDQILSRHAREEAFERFGSTATGHEKPGRYWKIDLERITVPSASHDGGSVTISAAGRVVAVDLATAFRDHREKVERAFGKATGAHLKFAHLTRAFLNAGAFVYVPADASIDEPVVITYRASGGSGLFPYTLVLAERGARVTIIERIAESAYTCGVAEIVTEESAQVTFANAQLLDESSTVLYTRAALPGRDARVAWAGAELGAALSVTDIETVIAQPGVESHTATLFFPGNAQHVDIVSTVDHRAGDSTSETVVKSAANGAGQARYLGNIRIAAHAQRSDASLRDDALLLSKRAHIDSIPALEIAANDVKAYHGATVGALDDEAIFYMTSRGLDRAEAERMIALGFFEPVVDLFPTEALREELRSALATKVQR